MGMIVPTLQMKLDKSAHAAGRRCLHLKWPSTYVLNFWIQSGESKVSIFNVEKAG